LAKFDWPVGITTDSSNNVWVVDGVNHRAQKFNCSGTYLSQLGCASGACTPGAGNGQFNYPSDIGYGNR
jgi:tripartite motif-containing protein 71